MERSKKWYEKTGWIIILTLLFFPVGLFLMWKYANWNKIIKIAVTSFYVLVVIITRSSSPSTDTPQVSQAVPDVPSITEEYKASLAQTFCDERSKPYTRAVNLSDFIAMAEADGKEVNLRPANGVYPTKDNCKKVADICLNVWNKEECEDIATRKIWIGMDDDQLMLSWGLPDDRNNTVSSWGVRSQWVYGLGEYVYLEGKSNNELKVTSWQN